MDDLSQVRAMIDKTVRGDLEFSFPDEAWLLGGKMLRSKLALAVGDALDTPFDEVVRVAAAVEIAHAASLLHDDVIDGADIRRGAPTLWRQKGVKGAILMGDLLVFRALELMRPISAGWRLDLWIETGLNVCLGEMEQELTPEGRELKWEESLEIARRKTGSLFAFAAAAASNPARAEALRESGYRLGTAYQVADDLLDEYGTTEEARKTLGRDRELSKSTTISNPPTDPREIFYNLLKMSREPIAEQKKLSQVWKLYLDEEIEPLLEDFLAS